MAYKSRVTNKYMGATFAGNVNAATSTETSELIDILQRDVNPALRRIYDKGVQNKKDAAVQKMNELYATKDTTTINKEILDGLHPELSGRYVDKTVQYHRGRHEAVDAIKRIEENKNKYDFQETNLPAFYKEYLPSFADKDGSYALGFSAVFNNYKAKEALADAEVRNNFTKAKKIEEGVKIISASDIEDVWATANSLKTPLPPEEGEKGVRYMYSNEEINSVVIEYANNLLNTSETTDGIDKALKILSTERGVGKDGMKLGSLVNTKRKDVSDLILKLNNRRVQLVTQERILSEYEDNKNKKDLIKKLFELDVNKQEKSYAEKQKMLEEAKQFGDIPFYNSINNIITSDISQVNNNPDELSDFMNSILEGDYTDFNSMIADFDKNKFSPNHLNKAVTYFNTYETRYEKGLRPIWQTDETYTGSMSYILNAATEPFKDKLGNLIGGGEMVEFRARNYIIKAIEEAELTFYEENQREPIAKERQEIIENIGNYVIKQFSSKNKKAELLTLTEREERDLKLEEDRKELEKKYQDVGLDVVLQNLQTRLSNTTNIPELPEMETSILKSRKTEREEYEQNVVTPAVQDFLKKSFGVELTPAMWTALSEADAQNIYTQVAKAFNNIDPKIVQIAIGQILKGN